MAYVRNVRMIYTMRYEIISKHGSTYRHQEKDLSAAIHYAKEHNSKVKDTLTGKIIYNFCKEKCNVNQKN